MLYPFSTPVYDNWQLCDLMPPQPELPSRPTAAISANSKNLHQTTRVCELSSINSIALATVFTAGCNDSVGADQFIAPKEVSDNRIQRG